MAAWKQIFIAAAIVVVAAAAWVSFFPGAREVLARYGIEWAQAAPTPDKPAANADNNGGSGERRRGGQGGAPQTAVITSPVVTATINDRLRAIGTGRATASVTVAPYASGRLVEIPVKAGDVVDKGAVLARLDSETEEIALDRARIALDDARAKLERTKQLRQSNNATTVQVTEAELAVKNAELAQRDAELTLERRSIVAPIAGIVGILPVEVGNYVTTQTAIATIDDRSRILVDFWVPERYATAIKSGAPLKAVPIARQGEEFDGKVSAIDNRIDEQSRTLRVQAEIPNPDDTLRAGMSFEVTMQFAGDTFPSVNPLAIQWGTDGSFVWTVRDGKAIRTPVRIIQRNTESVLVEASIGQGDIVVTEGIHAVREGQEVLIADRRPASPASGATAATGSGT